MGPEQLLSFQIFMILLAGLEANQDLEHQEECPIARQAGVSEKQWAQLAILNCLSTLQFLPAGNHGSKWGSPPLLPPPWRDQEQKFHRGIHSPDLQGCSGNQCHSSLVLRSARHHGRVLQWELRQHSCDLKSLNRRALTISLSCPEHPTTTSQLLRTVALLKPTVLWK